MGRKLDLSGLTDNEAEHVLQVVQRDMRLRKKEDERLSELKQELDEEGSRCLLLSRQSCFNQRCCIRCCSTFTFLLNPKQQCRDCHYNVCRACCVYNKRDGAWLCSACQKNRLLKKQSLEWFYTNVKKRFKRFGSAKVLKTLYRKHLAEHSALSELTEGSAYEESICNEGSVSESDSTFYRQSEEHSMAETLSVALRVAEEAIDEAISKAEFDSASQKKQNEAHYLREHRGELIEELAKTIVQKIISRRKTLAEMRADYNQEWPLEQNTDNHDPRSTSEQASSSVPHQPGLWRSQSACSLLASDSPGLIQDSSQMLKKEGGGSAMSAWKSVDRLDNAGVSSVLKSPDGNWIALQSAQLSRPSLLTKRKSLVYSALEKESGVVSAYEDMGSDNEAKPDKLDSSWGAMLQEIHRKIKGSNLNLRDRISSVLMGRQGRREEAFSDSEGNRKLNKPLFPFFSRKLPAEMRQPSSSSPRTSIIDVNFNVGSVGEEERGSVGAEQEVGKVRRVRRKRSKKEQAASSTAEDSNRKDSQSDHDAITPDTLTSGASTPEPLEPNSDHGANQMEADLQQAAGRVSDLPTGREELDRDADDDIDNGQRVEGREGERGEDDDRLWKMEIDVDEERTEDEKEEEERDLEVGDESMKERLYRLVAQSRLTYFSSTDEELNKLAQGKDPDDDMEDCDEDREEKKMERRTYRLCRLEKEVEASQFSSTEDELDRAADDEELAVKVCRLADQVNATQFSSTEDELDALDRGEEEALNEQTLWKLQAEKMARATQLRDLASLVSASQFSSTEDELDRVGESKGAMEWDGRDGVTNRRRGSFEDLDVKIFELMDESSDEEGTDGGLNSEPRTEDVRQDETEMDKAKNDDLFIYDLFSDTQREMKDERTRAQRKIFEDELEDEAGMEKEEMKLKSAAGSENMEEKAEEINKTIVELEKQPEAKWPDKDERDGQREETFEDKESQVKRETAADNYEDESEFERIISSMLMMTLDDMQVETVKYGPAGNEEVRKEEEDGDTDEPVEDGRGGRLDKQSRKASETETASEKNTVDEKLGENVTEQTGGDATTTESRDAGIRQEHGDQGLPAETDDTQRTSRREEEEQEKNEGETHTMEVNADGESLDKDKDENREETEGNPDEMEPSSTEGSLSPQDVQSGSDTGLYRTVEFISTLLEQRYSAVSLRSITTEVLKVLNATEDLLQGVEGDGPRPSTTTSLPPNSDPKKLDQQFSRLEENVYVAAGSVFSLEAELNDLEECARGVCSATSDMELSYLEEQVASAAAKVQQSELQICDISARIAALKNAGLNVDTQSRFKTRTIPVMPITLDTSRKLRRRLPAPPVKENKKTQTADPGQNTAVP